MKERAGISFSKGRAAIPMEWEWPILSKTAGASRYGGA